MEHELGKRRVIVKSLQGWNKMGQWGKMKKATRTCGLRIIKRISALYNGLSCQEPPQIRAAGSVQHAEALSYISFFWSRQLRWTTVPRRIDPARQLITAHSWATVVSTSQNITVLQPSIGILERYLSRSEYDRVKEGGRIALGNTDCLEVQSLSYIP